MTSFTSSSLQQLHAHLTASSKSSSSPSVDYAAVRRSIASVLDDDKYDDGSYGPLFVRLAWHSSGSYCSKNGNGGSNGALIRFSPEKDWGGNAGIAVAIERLEPVKKKHPDITYGDLYTLAGVVAVEEMNGPIVKWRPGRVDQLDGKNSPTADDRLPDASQRSCPYLRSVFSRMGFSDRDIVALSGAHSLGRCHVDRSGYDGPWSRAPTNFSNAYFRHLIQMKWTPKKWSGPLQYENSDSGSDLMMLPTDMALLDEPAMRAIVEEYAANKDRFFADFASAFGKLLELGCVFSHL